TALTSFPYLESLRIDLRIHPEAIERRLLDRVGPDGAAQAEGELHAVDVVVLREVEKIRRWRRGSAASLSRGRRLRRTRGGRAPGWCGGCGRCASLCARRGGRQWTRPSRTAGPPASGRRTLPAHHQRQMRVLRDEQPKREVVRTLRVNHVRFALRRFRFAGIREGERVRAERCREHAEREPCEVLLERDHS